VKDERDISMTDVAAQQGWWDSIARRAGERDRRRQILYNDVRKAVLHRNVIAQFVEEYIPEIVGEFFKMIAGSLIGFWVIGKLLAYVFHVNSLYTFSVLGLVFSVQATYYKYRLSANPDFKIPKCKCSGHRADSTTTVLQSGQSALLGIPISMLGAVFYAALVMLSYFRHPEGVAFLVVGGVAVSAYLSYGMVSKIGGLCANCVNVAALNILLLIRLIHL
jgi:uncharacterized membrane protein